MCSIHFLNLPRELRDDIYSYALQHEKPLQYLPVDAKWERHKPGSYTSTNSPTEYNQIKYANRQLWMETAGLEVRCNTLVFSRLPWKANTEEVSALEAMSHSDGLTLFLGYLRELHQKWISYLQEVRIVSQPRNEDEGTESFLVFSTADIQAYSRRRRASDSWTVSDM